MRYRLAIAAAAVICLAGTPARAQDHEAPDPCSSESDLIQCWTRAAERSDEEMNTLVNSLAEKLGKDAGNELRRSQKAWLEYRMAHLAMLGAAGREPRARQSRSDILLCATIARWHLAAQRIRHLRLMLEPATDDACPV